MHSARQVRTVPLDHSTACCLDSSTATFIHSDSGTLTVPLHSPVVAAVFLVSPCGEDVVAVVG